MRISDWSSDVCSSDLGAVYLEAREAAAHGLHGKAEIVGNVAPCHRQRDRTGRPAPALLTRGDLKQKGRDLLHRGLAAQKDHPVLCGDQLQDRKSTRLNSSH